MRISILALAVFLLFSTACERIFFDEVPSAENGSIFEQTWNFADQEYVFFPYKNVNWDSIKLMFETRALEAESDEELFDVLADMLYLLKDGHVNLRSDFDRSRNWNFRLDYPQNFDYNILERNYFNADQQFVGPFIVYDFGDVGYMYYGSFSSAFTDEHLDYILKIFSNYKGLIIDIRDNGGGSLGNALRIAERFVNESQVVAHLFRKNGPGHSDFTNGSTIELNPDENTFIFERPTVVLTNRSSYSASSFFAQFMREIINVTLIGDYTGGGGGAPANTELTNGWNLRVSSTLTTSPDGFNIEDGVPPDIMVDMFASDSMIIDSSTKDEILETALEFLRM